MIKKEINEIVVLQLYNFIAEGYNIAVANYIYDIFGIEKNQLFGSNLQFETFCKMLQYLHKMSGDRLICYNAGRYFERKKLRQATIIPSLRFSIKKTFRKINIILKDYFPCLEFSIQNRRNNSLLLIINSAESSIKPDYFFSEYLKGIVSSIPHSWDMPSADAKIISYLFSFDDLVKNLDIEYSKKNGRYHIYDKEIALEKEIASESVNTGDPGLGEEKKKSVQLALENFYIKNVFIGKNTILNSEAMKLQIRWRNPGFIKKIVFGALSLLGASAFLFVFLYQLLPQFHLITLLLLYESIVILLYNLFRSKSLKDLYLQAEFELTKELSEQREATDNAVTNTYTRLQSLENLIEITKRIIYEKNIAALMDNIRRLTAKALNADRATVFIHDKESKELSSGPQLSEESKEIRFPDDRGIAGQVLKLKKIINVKDAYNHPLFNKAVDKQTGFKTNTILSAPLFDLDQNAIGIIQVLNKQKGIFEEIDEQILKTLSTYIAIALKDSLTINKLQIQGIDPELIKGLSGIIEFIFDKYKSLREAVQKVKEAPVHGMRDQLEDVFVLLEKLYFLFVEEYVLKESPVSIKTVLNILHDFMAEKTETKNIGFESKLALPEETALQIDLNLFKRALCPVLENSIEAVLQDGKIEIDIHHYVDLPNTLIHELALFDILTEYNTFNHKETTSFIDFLKSRKPFLDEELNKIGDSLKEFLAFDIFNSGSKIENIIKTKMFNPFFSTKNHFGLGLAVARAAVTKMGGLIEEPRNEKEGMSLTILIPFKRS